MASIEQRTTKKYGTVYSVRYRVGKNQRREKGPTYREAKIRKAEIELAGNVANGNLSTLTVEEYARMWLKRNWGRLLANTRKTFRVLSVIVGGAIAEGAVTTDPRLGVVCRKTSDATAFAESRVITEADLPSPSDIEQIAIRVEWTAPGCGLLIRAIGFLGLRRQEAIALTRLDVVLKPTLPGRLPYLRIHSSVEDVPREYTDSGERRQDHRPLSQSAARNLRRHLEGHDRRGGTGTRRRDGSLSTEDDFGVNFNSLMEQVVERIK